MSEEPKRIANIDSLVPELRDIVRLMINDILYYNLSMRVFECVRSIERQKWCFDRGASKTMNSRHLANSQGFSEAVDFVVHKNGKWSWDKEDEYLYKMLGELVIGKYPRLEWGGTWKFRDYPHYQLRT